MSAGDDPAGPSGPRLLLVMGVAGSGKTTVGRDLAAALDADFVEADDYHSAANMERLRHGIPLDDAARAPWLRDVRHAIATRIRRGRRVVLACSALKATYRDELIDGVPGAVVVYLRVDRPTLEGRLRRRPHQFMASLLDSQLADLEVPEGAIVADESDGEQATVASILGQLGRG